MQYHLFEKTWITRALQGSSTCSRNNKSFKAFHRRKQFPYRAVDEEKKNKKCPHCNETFYYAPGVKIHIEHAHHNTIRVFP